MCMGKCTIICYHQNYFSVNLNVMDLSSNTIQCSNLASEKIPLLKKGKLHIF